MVPVLLQRLAHTLVLGDELHEFVVFQVLALREQDVQPVVGDVADTLVARVQAVAVQEVVEHLLLEDLDDLQLATSLQLEALQLRQGTVKLEHGVAECVGMGLSAVHSTAQRQVHTAARTAF